MTRKEAVIACMEGYIIGHAISRTTEWMYTEVPMNSCGNFMTRDTETDQLSPGIFYWHKDYYIIKKKRE